MGCVRDRSGTDRREVRADSPTRRGTPKETAKCKILNVKCKSKVRNGK